MNSEREQLKEQYKKYLSRLEASDSKKTLKKTPGQFCGEHCDLKEALLLLVQAKHLDFLKEEEEEIQKKELKTKIRFAIFTGALGFLSSITVAFLTLFVKLNH